MGLANKQRDSLIEACGQPILSLEFDVWPDGQVSMWTHLKHGEDYNKTREQFVAIRNHLDKFLRAEAMCPFYKDGPIPAQEAKKESA